MTHGLPRINRLAAVLGAVLLFVLGVAGCGGSDSHTTGGLSLRLHVSLSWPPRYNEHTYVGVEGRQYRVRVDRELRLRLPIGVHKLDAWRSGPGGGRCSRDVTVSEGETARATIQNLPDRSSATLGAVGAECRIIVDAVSKR